MRAPRLLVSVVDAEEAAAAAAAGAHIIDAKDPSRGALGAVSAGALARILAACPDRVLTSAALGDLAELTEAAGVPGRSNRTLVTRPARAPGRWTESSPGRLSGLAVASFSGRLTYVKVGLGGCPGAAEARLALQSFLAARPDFGPGARADFAPRARPAERLAAGSRGRGEPASPPRLIVASYADHARAGAPSPDLVPDLAAEAGAAGCLLDTGCKDGSCLLDWMNEAALEGFVRACRARGLLCALAGSLRPEHLPRVARLRPDLVGVRGAACDGDRVHGRVRAERVAALAGGLAGACR